VIPRITPGGTSFKGAAQYYLHDKGATTRERVAWTHTENLLTDDPAKAWKVMAWTAKEAERLKEASGQRATGRKLTKPVFAYSLSWHPEQQPGKAELLAAARKSLDRLGLAEHESVIICHRDEPQPHVHVVVNRVHPVTGLAASTSQSKRKLSDFAREHEREHGKIYCQQRETNHAKRQRKEPARYCDPVILQAWQQSDNGRGFAAALREQGYHLAQGRKRLVVVDRYGQTHNPVRHLENVRAAQFQQRLQDVELARLPDATQLSRTIQAENRRRYDASLRHDAQVTQVKNQLQDRHLEERARLSAEHADRLSREQDELARHYCLPALQAEIAALRERTRQPGIWKRLFGLSRRDATRLHELEQSHANAQWRVQERLDRLAVERDAALARLKERQATVERRTLERLESRKPAGYVNDQERERLREPIREQRQRRGPSLER